jgi:hypothetical protein
MDTYLLMKYRKTSWPYCCVTAWNVLELQHKVDFDFRLQTCRDGTEWNEPLSQFVERAEVHAQDTV